MPTYSRDYLRFTLPCARGDGNWLTSIVARTAIWGSAAERRMKAPNMADIGFDPFGGPAQVIWNAPKHWTA
ncbi:MAG: hypothetical protein AAF748_06320 [Pseudomonadota bacterium]